MAEWDYAAVGLGIDLLRIGNTTRHWFSAISTQTEDFGGFTLNSYRAQPVLHMSRSKKVNMNEY
jgi:hypothetical protein